MRARHCSKCNKCVHRFDHHCPWTGNCIGKNNIKVFIQFLFYSSFTCIFFSVIQLFSYFVVLKNNVIVSDSIIDFRLIDEHKLYISSIENVIFKVTTYVTMIIGFSIAYLFAYQIKNMEKNITTVEHAIIKDRDYSPFDSGYIK